ncbi:hypothetical protein ACFYY5_29400 [Nocardia elegans]|uniref:Uncharacterized protein n=1 Tax=Nocardia elegans TaxID=300029 RepID=A0ABW6TLG6_9NOCA
MNLIWRHKEHGWTWADNYNDYGPDYAGPNAYNALIQPMILWATAEANKRGGDGIERYGISS